MANRDKNAEIHTNTDFHWVWFLSFNSEHSVPSNYKVHFFWGQWVCAELYLSNLYKHSTTTGLQMVISW